MVPNDPRGAGDLRHWYRGALLGTAIGDALGAPFEGQRRISPFQVRALGEGVDVLRYTDDTHMTIGLAESFIACGGFDGELLGAHLAARYEAEPWRGYGPGPPRVFEAVAAGVGWDDAAREVYGRQGSFGNGGAMRVTPVALLHLDDRERTVAAAAGSASVTHAHPLGIEGAVLQALAVRWALRHDPDASADGLLDELLPNAASSVFADKLRAIRALVLENDGAVVARRIGNDVTAPGSVPAAILCFGADAIPSTWVDRIEDRDHLEALADGLFAMRTAG